MNIAKNMEVIFLSTLVLVGATSFASAAAPAHRTPAPLVQQAAVQVDAGAPMAVVTITAKRLSAAQKAQLGN